MSWRTVVVSRRCKLDYKLDHLVIRGEEVQRIHLSEIAVLIIENTAVSLTAYLLNELMKSKVKVIFCDEKRNPGSELISYYGSHDTSAKVKEQVNWGKEIKEIIWTEIVKEKIEKQMILLALLDKAEAVLLQSYLSDVKNNDVTNREGHAAKVYFNSLFGQSFSRSIDSPLNSALNFGYSLLLSSFNREICANGYITQLGLSHHNRFNPFNFASDLMEPFRPLIDVEVVNLMPVKFDKEEKVKLLQVCSKRIKIIDKYHFLPNVISIFCKSVFEALETEDIQKIRHYSYEL